MHKKPANRHSWGLNTKKAWYIGPCLQHYRTFKGILSSTGGERMVMLDTANMKHYVIAILELTLADIIPEAACQLDHVIK